MSIAAAFRHPISYIGALLAGFSAILFLVVFFLDLLGFHTNPYIGIFFFIVLPSVFILGLLLIPFGMWWERRHPTRGTVWPRIDLNDPRHRRTAVIVLALTFANVVVLSLAAFRGIEYMDSVAFCGQVCHEVMEPQYVAYQDSPHSRVACVQCHIGPGAPWFVQSKLSGTRQVFAVTLDTFSRPIPTPVEHLRPARDTCEQCHWPEKFHGDKLEVRREYAHDEANSETVTTLRIHVGGGSERLGVAAGIHWHMSIANRIDYITTDDRRMVIPYVELMRPDGEVVRYVVDDVTPEELTRGERRTMDCVDCHNRPSHPFSASADRAVDLAMTRGEMDITLPFLKREAVATLELEHPTQQAGLEAIAAALEGFYRDHFAGQYQQWAGQVGAAVTATQRVYRRNVFPRMNVGWGTYPNQIGHMDFPGCFRCHDDEHRSPDGAVIRQDCDLCHQIE
jgi:hypothetical protein